MTRSVGVEEELFLVDSETMEPLDRSSEALAADTGGPGADEELDQELFLAQLETNSEPSDTGEQLLDYVRRGRERAAEDASAVGAALLVSPTSVVGAVRRLTPTARYRSIRQGRTDAKRVRCCGFLFISSARQSVSGRNFAIRLPSRSPERGFPAIPATFSTVGFCAPHTNCAFAERRSVSGRRSAARRSTSRASARSAAGSATRMRSS